MNNTSAKDNHLLLISILYSGKGVVTTSLVFQNSKIAPRARCVRYLILGLDALMGPGCFSPCLVIKYWFMQEIYLPLVSVSLFSGGRQDDGRSGCQIVAEPRCAHS